MVHVSHAAWMFALSFGMPHSIVRVLARGPFLMARACTDMRMSGALGNHSAVSLGIEARQLLQEPDHIPDFFVVHAFAPSGHTRSFYPMFNRPKRLSWFKAGFRKIGGRRI